VRVKKTVRRVIKAYTLTDFMIWFTNLQQNWSIRQLRSWQALHSTHAVSELRQCVGIFSGEYLQCVSWRHNLL